MRNIWQQEIDKAPGNLSMSGQKEGLSHLNRI